MVCRTEPLDTSKTVALAPVPAASASWFPLPLKASVGNPIRVAGTSAWVGTGRPGFDTSHTALEASWGWAFGARAVVTVARIGRFGSHATATQPGRPVLTRA